MGYEELDAAGSSSRPGRPPRRDEATPFALDLPEQPNTPARKQRLPWSGRRAIALAAILLTVGAAVGAGWARHLADQSEQVRGRSVAKVVAARGNLEVVPVAGGTRVEYAVRLTNLGPLSVDLATDAGIANATFARPQVSLLRGSTVLQPGRSSVARVSFLADCTSTERIAQAVSVRSHDGQMHQVPVLDAPQNSSEDEVLSEKQICEQFSGQDIVFTEDLTSKLSGRFDRPAVTLHNAGARPLTVELDPEVEMLTVMGNGGGPGLEITTTPALPLRIAAKGTVRLRLAVKVDKCRQLPADLTLDQYPTTLSVRAVDTPDNQDTGTQVDVRSIVATALDRACR